MELKSRINPLSISTLAFLALLSNRAVAHPMHPGQGTFSDGFTHGLIAWDHWLGALMVGFLCRIVFAEYDSRQGKILAAVTTVYTLSHLSAVSLSGGALAGLFAGFIGLGFLGALLGQFTYITVRSPQIKWSFTAIALAGLMLSWP